MIPGIKFSKENFYFLTVLRRLIVLYCMSYLCLTAENYRARFRDDVLSLGRYFKRFVIHMSTVLFIPACAVSSSQPATKFHAAPCSLSSSQWDGGRIRKR